MTLARRTGVPLTVDDWVQAGFALLSEGGPNALRIGRLCERLEVTKGSFYWHFTDMCAYRTALSAAWADLHDERRERFESLRAAGGRERLEEMIQALIQPDHWALERAMRIWAMTDESIQQSVRLSDERVRSEVRQAFLDCGFDDEEASLRSSVLFATAVGLLHEAPVTHAQPAPLRGSVLNLMLGR
jgi:AcrR family transcriptional regulator